MHRLVVIGASFQIRSREYIVRTPTLSEVTEAECEATYAESAATQAEHEATEAEYQATEAENAVTQAEFIKPLQFRTATRQIRTPQFRIRRHPGRNNSTSAEFTVPP